MFTKTKVLFKQFIRKKHLIGTKLIFKQKRDMKRVIFYVMLVPLFMGLISSCTNTKVDAKSLDGKWTIIEVKGEKVNKEKMPFIEFKVAENKVHGNAGCNIFNTTMKLDESNVSAISFNQAVSTMMACPDMELEGKVFNTFENVAEVKAGKTENEMLLVDKDGATLLVLSRN